MIKRIKAGRETGIYKVFILSKQVFIINRNIHNHYQEMLGVKNSTECIKQMEIEGRVKSHFEKQQDLYAVDINMAIYMDLSDVQKLHIFDIIAVNDQQDFVVTFYGFKMRLDDHMSQKLYKLFIRQMDTLLRNQTNRKYYVVFFDSSSENKNSFDHFKDIFKRLSALYFFKLNKIFHVHPDFFTKSFGMINFTSWSKMFYKHIEFVENVESIQQISQLKIFNILVKCPKQLTKGVKIQTPTPNVVKSAIHGSKRPKPFDCLKKQFKEYTIDQSKHAPLILSILIETMKKSRQICMAEGIFRIAGSIEDEEELLKEIIDLNKFCLIDTETHCKRAISGLMKKIFTESASPLIPYPIYNFILNQNIDENNIGQFWKQILAELPPLNRSVLCYVTEFLREFILKNTGDNKMNSHNLSVVFNPCFFRAKECSIADLMNSGKFAGFFKWWLQHYDEVIEKYRTPMHDSRQSSGQNQQEKEMELERKRNIVSKINYEGGLSSSRRDGLMQ